MFQSPPRFSPRIAKKPKTDRFIPSSSGPSNFHLNLSCLALLNSFDSRDGFSSLPDKDKDQLVDQFEHETAMANALGYQSIPDRVLVFSAETCQFSETIANEYEHPAEAFRRTGRISADNIPYYRQLLGRPFVQYLTRHPRKKTSVNLFLPDKVLDAPEIENDFYSSPVSWSQNHNLISAALRDSVYTWSETNGPQNLDLPISSSLVCCIAFSKNNILAISQKDGSLTFYDMNTNRVLVTYQHPDNFICCMTWKIDSANEIYVGDRNGMVIHLILKWIDTYAENNNESEFAYNVFSNATLRGHTEQICGIDISPDLTQVAIGGNDNCVTIWNITQVNNPILQFRLPHKAAVKALAFCPWAPSLLATGGGSHDRSIKFWYTKSGSLLESHDVKAQVTTLIWSKTYNQIAATFGFGHSPSILSVYSFPKFRLLRQSLKAPNVRAVGAVSSPDHSTICLASSDQTLRFYKLWPPVRSRSAAGSTISSTAQRSKKRNWQPERDKRGRESSSLNVVQPILPFIADTGLFGSEIIDMVEGFDLLTNLVR